MSLDCNDLLRAVKQAAVEAVRAGDPMDVLVGTVTAVDPLNVTVGQKLILTAEQLILTSNVRDTTVEMTMDHYTESQSGGSDAAAFASHAHAYRGKKQFLVHRALRVGEPVILLSCAGGQRYVVLDRLEVS